MKCDRQEWTAGILAGKDARCPTEQNAFCDIQQMLICRV